jgi:hypothetical protein
VDTEGSERMTDIRKVYKILEKLERRRPQESPLHRWEEMLQDGPVCMNSVIWRCVRATFFAMEKP